MAAGKLIVFEGAEGAGKSTQIRLLLQRLAADGIVAAAFREPGGTPVGDAIRAIVLAREGEMSPSTEAVLFMASDSMIGWKRFVAEFRGADVAIIVTYHLGQVLLVLGLLG